MAITSIRPDFKNFLGDSFQGEFGRGVESKKLILQPMGRNPLTGAVKLTFRDGTSIQLEDYPSDVQKLIETLGPNGATDTLADALRNLAKKLLAEGKITTMEANQLAQLANFGHVLAKNQRIREDFAKESGDDSQLFADKIKAFQEQEVLNIKPVTQLDPAVAALFRMGASGPGVILDEKGKVIYESNGDPKLDYSKLEAVKIPKDHFDFIQEFGVVSHSRIFQEPVLKAVISALAVNISGIANDSGCFSNRAALSAFSVTPDQINQKISDSSHKYSVDICAAGGGADSGIQCPSHQTQ
ncbi:MAG: hypothetical protein K2X66_09435 [Cyanobacteria bacterium]|nr:hypothetical protein [Cyanobacteriota bacterium]